MDERRVQPDEVLGAEAPARQRTRPIAVDQDVRALDELAQGRPAVLGPEVGEGGALAEAGVDHQRLDRRQVRGADAQNLGAVLGERPADGRAGDDAAEVEHTHARERRLPRRQGVRPGVADPGKADQRAPREMRRVALCLPLGTAALPNGAGARSDGPVLDLLRGHARDPRRDCLAILRQVERGEQSPAQMRKGGVQIDPSVGGTEIAGQRVPLERRATVDRQVGAGRQRQRCLPPVDRDPLRQPGPALVQRGRRQPDQRLRRRGEVGNRQRRGQRRRRRADLDPLPGRAGPAERRRERARYGDRRRLRRLRGGAHPPPAGSSVVIPSAPAMASSSLIDIGIMSPRAQSPAKWS